MSIDWLMKDTNFLSDVKTVDDLTALRSCGDLTYQAFCTALGYPDDDSHREQYRLFTEFMQEFSVHDMVALIKFWGED